MNTHGRSYKLRLIMAAVVAGIGLLTYFLRTEVNPVTGEKQRIALSTDQEIALGLNSAPQMAAQMGGAVPTSEPDAALVAHVGARLVRTSDAARSPYRYDFHLLRDENTVNAFALPGGQIFITRGLLFRLESEAQLAGVLAHEIGHVVNRHGAEHLAKAQLTDSLTIAVGVGASDERGGGQAAYAISQVVGQMIQLRYGRKDELESDSFGLRTMTQAGFDPRAMLEVMRVLSEAGGSGRQPEFLSSHPYPENRITAIRDWIAEHYPRGIPSELTLGRTLK